MNVENSSKIIIDENRKFINPSQLEQSLSGIFFKCEICDFVSARKTSIMEHKESMHNWCLLCFSSFKIKQKLKKHVKDLHSDK